MANYAKETTRERIIKAAFDAFDQLDYHETTVRDIAKKSGISPAAMYKHFRSKDELAQAICTEKVRQMVTELEEQFIGMRGALNKLRKMTWYYLRFYELNPGVGWVLRVSTSIKAWLESPEAMAPVRDSAQLFWNIIQEGQDAGEIRRDINLRAAIYIYFGGLNYMVELWLLRNRSYSITAYADDFTDIICTVIRTTDKTATVPTCPYVKALKRQRPKRRPTKLDIANKAK